MKKNNSSNIILLLSGTNNILASYHADIIPPKNSILSIEEPNCSCQVGFSYKEYKVVSDPKFSIQREATQNDNFFQRVFLEIDPIKNSK